MQLKDYHTVITNPSFADASEGCMTGNWWPYDTVGGLFNWHGSRVSIEDGSRLSKN